jgi:hypothetical protein
MIHNSTLDSEETKSFLIKKIKDFETVFESEYDLAAKIFPRRGYMRDELSTLITKQHFFGILKNAKEYIINNGIIQPQRREEQVASVQT